MAKTFVQRNSQQSSGANALAYTTNIGGTGSILVAHVWWKDGNDLTSFVDSRGNTWTALGTKIVGTGGVAGTNLLSYVCLSPSAGATTVTATPSSAVSCGLCILEYNGFTGTPTVTGTPVYNQASGVSTNSGDVTSTIADAIFCSSCYPQDAINTVSNGYTTRAPSGVFDPNWGGGQYGDDIVVSIQTNLHATYGQPSNFANLISNFAIGDGTAAAPSSAPNLIILSGNRW